jgi:hypothetical protein
MNDIQEGTLYFSFDTDCCASHYDNWSFYRNQFKDRCYRDNKAVDLLCYSTSDNAAWLIEVKDYRSNPRTKAIDLADEIANKVRDSLAGLVAAQFQANDPDERKYAREILRRKKLRVICHIEQPGTTSRLRPRIIEPDKLQQKMRTLLRAIDPHPMVMDAKASVSSVPWSVNIESSPNSG